MSESSLVAVCAVPPGTRHPDGSQLRQHRPQGGRDALTLFRGLPTEATELPLINLRTIGAPPWLGLRAHRSGTENHALPCLSVRVHQDTMGGEQTGEMSVHRRC